MILFQTFQMMRLPRLDAIWDKAICITLVFGESTASRTVASVYVAWKLGTDGNTWTGFDGDHITVDKSRQ